LLERVIRARRLHHSRFFAMNYDYGHAKYLEALSTEKGTIVKALERIERRTAEVRVYITIQARVCCLTHT
jgi:hypothetical protein